MVDAILEAKVGKNYSRRFDITYGGSKGENGCLSPEQEVWLHIGTTGNFINSVPGILSAGNSSKFLFAIQMGKFITPTPTMDHSARSCRRIGRRAGAGAADADADAAGAGAGARVGVRAGVGGGAVAGRENGSGSAYGYIRRGFG